MKLFFALLFGFAGQTAFAQGTLPLNVAGHAQKGAQSFGMQLDLESIDSQASHATRCAGRANAQGWVILNGEEFAILCAAQQGATVEIIARSTSGVLSTLKVNGRVNEQGEKRTLNGRAQLKRAAQSFRYRVSLTTR